MIMIDCRPELEQGLAHLGVQIPHADFNYAFDMADQNGNGNLTIDGICHFRCGTLPYANANSNE